MTPTITFGHFVYQTRGKISKEEFIPPPIQAMHGALYLKVLPFEPLRSNLLLFEYHDWRKKFALGYVFQQKFVLGQIYLTKGHPFINDIIYNPLKKTKVSLNFELLL